MRKHLLVLPLITFLFFINSCATIEFNPTYTIENIQGEDVVDIWLSADFSDGVWYSAGTEQYNLTVANKTNGVVQINWYKSAICYNNTSTTFFIGGQKYIEANTPAAPSTIPAYGTYSINAYGACQPYFQSNNYTSGWWSMIPIPAWNTKLVICITHAGGESFYTIDVNANAAEIQKDQ